MFFRCAFSKGAIRDERNYPISTRVLLMVTARLTHSRLIPICNAFFIQRGHRLSLPILRKKLLNGQMSEMKSQPLEQSSCLETQSQLEQSIARKREIRCEKIQNLTNVFR